jgi:hypothetical protein
VNNNNNATRIARRNPAGNTCKRILVVFRSSVAKSLEARYSGAANIPEVALLQLLRGLFQANNGVCPALFTSLQHASEARTGRDAEETRSLLRTSTGDYHAGALASHRLYAAEVQSSVI